MFNDNEDKSILEDMKYGNNDINVYKRAISIIMALCIFSTLFINIVFVVMFINKTGEMAKNYSVAISKKTVSIADSFADRYIEKLKIFSSRLAANPNALNNPAELKALLYSYTKDVTEDVVAIIWPDGHGIVYDSLERDFVQNFDAKGKKYYVKGFSNRSDISLFNSRSLRNQGKHKTILLCSVPVVVNGKVVAIISSEINTQDFVDLITLNDLDNFDTLVVDESGSFVFKIPSTISSVYENIYQASLESDADIKEEFIRQALADESTVTGEYKTHEGEKYLIFSPLRYNNWNILSVVTPKIAGKVDKSIFILTVLIPLIVNLLILSAFYSFLKKKQVFEQDTFNLLTTDILAKCPNKAYFYVTASKLIDKNKIEEFSKDYAVISMDFDEFKTIVSVYGMDNVQKLLNEVSHTIKRNLPIGATFGKIQNDNFAILCPYDDKDELVLLCKTLTKEFKKVRKNTDVKIKLIPSFGIFQPTFDELCDTSVLGLYEKAEFAKQHAKKVVQGNKYVFFDNDMKREIQLERNLEQDAEYALQNNEIYSKLQPYFYLDTNEPAFAQVVTYWNNKNVGVLTQEQFMPAFVRAGFGIEVSIHIFDALALRHYDWLKEGKEILPILKTLTKSNLKKSHFVDILDEKMTRYNIPKNNMLFEVSQDIFANNDVDIVNTVKFLDKSGFKLSVNDNGVGYNPTVIMNLPFKYLRIDHIYIEQAMENPENKIMLNKLIQAVSSLNTKTIVDNITNQAEYELAKELGIDIAGGDYFSKPLNENEYQAKIIDHSEDFVFRKNMN